MYNNSVNKGASKTVNFPYKGTTPTVHESVFVAPGAYIIGDVTIGEESTVWFNAVLRGDDGPILVGKRCSIQDNSTIHLYEGSPVEIGDDVTIGHNVILHGCKIGSNTIIGMGSTLLDNVGSWGRMYYWCKHPFSGWNKNPSSITRSRFTRESSP
jgi:carbonic anhydrase/acetyltransferase-like protein (isoleucine patch superfamily)